MYKLFIFDFDGTLGDTKECVVACFDLILAENQLPAVPRDAIIHLMGVPLKDIFIKLIDEPRKDEFYNQLVTDYRILYKQLLSQKTFIFPEVADTLKILKEKKALCTIATSKKTELAKASCKYLAIDQYIDLYVGDDEVTHKKPHPEMLVLTLERLALDKDQAVMIGDATYDMEMGNAIGMDTIAVTWGSHSEELLQSVRPTRIIHKFSELAAFA